MKGSVSYITEQKMISDLIQSQESLFLDNNKYDVNRVVQKVLNSFKGKRVISKAEVCVELAGLKLVSCTENFEKVRTHAYTKLTVEVRIT